MELILTRRCLDVSKVGYTLRCMGDRVSEANLTFESDPPRRWTWEKLPALDTLAHILRGKVAELVREGTLRLAQCLKVEGPIERSIASPPPSPCSSQCTGGGMKRGKQYF